MKAIIIAVISVFGSVVGVKYCKKMQCLVDGGFRDDIAELCTDCYDIDLARDVCYVKNLKTSMKMCVEYDLSSFECKDFYEAYVTLPGRSNALAYNCIPGKAKPIYICDTNNIATCDSDNPSVPCDVKTCLKFDYIPRTEGVKNFGSEWFPNKIDCSTTMEVEKLREGGLHIDVGGGGVEVGFH